jgi:phosphatidyl-myo-inositol alpha-mannosyltransferase
LEAMAAGKPIVSSDIQGYRDVVTHDREALLVPPKDPERLSGALIHLLADPDLRVRLGTQGNATAQRYSWARVADEVLDFYTETIHRHMLLTVLRRPRFRRVRRVASGVAHLLSR